VGNARRGARKLRDRHNEADRTTQEKRSHNVGKDKSVSKSTRRNETWQPTDRVDISKYTWGDLMSKLTHGSINRGRDERVQGALTRPGKFTVVETARDVRGEKKHGKITAKEGS